MKSCANTEKMQQSISCLWGVAFLHNCSGRVQLITDELAHFLSRLCPRGRVVIYRSSATISTTPIERPVDPPLIVQFAYSWLK